MCLRTGSLEEKIILWDAVDSLALDDSASSFLTSWKHLRHSTAPTRAADTISHSEEAIIPPTARAGVGGGSFALGLDRRHRGVDMLRHNTAAVHETAHQLFIVARVAPDHGGGRLKDRHGDLLEEVGLLLCDDINAEIVCASQRLTWCV